MEKGKSLSVGLLVELAEGRRQGLTHEENARLHGVCYSTSKYGLRQRQSERQPTVKFFLCRLYFENGLAGPWEAVFGRPGARPSASKSARPGTPESELAD